MVSAKTHGMVMLVKCTIRTTRHDTTLPHARKNDNDGSRECEFVEHLAKSAGNSARYISTAGVVHCVGHVARLLKDPFGREPKRNGSPSRLFYSFSLPVVLSSRLSVREKCGGIRTRWEYVRAATPTGLYVVLRGRSACGPPKGLVALR